MQSTFQRKTLQRRNAKHLTLSGVDNDIGVANIVPPVPIKVVDNQRLNRTEGTLSLRRNFKKKLSLDPGDKNVTRLNSSGSSGTIQGNHVIIPSGTSMPDISALYLGNEKELGRRKPNSPNMSTKENISQLLSNYSRNNTSSSSNNTSEISLISPTNPKQNGFALNNDNPSIQMKTKNDVNSDISSQIELENLVQLGRIGSGNSGTVTKALHVPDSRIIAKKVIAVETNNEIVIKQIMRELSIMKSVKTHSNIIEFFGAFYNHSDYNELVILLEYMNCGSLDQILKMNKSMGNIPDQTIILSGTLTWFDELSISKISYSVLTALDYLYENYKIIHRDIKPSNILINSKGQVKICDFGVSKTMVNSIANTFVGTSTYMSPERIQGNVYSTKGDVWSLGLMIIELVTGEFPLNSDEMDNNSPDGILDLLQRIVNEPSPKLPYIENGEERSSIYSVEITDFVNRCCIKSAEERSPINELLCHDFIAKYNNNSSKSRQYTLDREFRHWCKKIKSYIKARKQLKREEIERAKYEQKQLEKSAKASLAKR